MADLQTLHEVDLRLCVNRGQLCLCVAYGDRMIHIHVHVYMNIDCTRRGLAHACPNYSPIIHVHVHMYVLVCTIPYTSQFVSRPCEVVHVEIG